MIFTGNSKGLLQVYNLSTGIIVNKNCLQKVPGRVQCICFDSTGSNLWIGDDKGSIQSFHFDAFTLKLNKTKKIISNSGYSITSISYKSTKWKDQVTPNLLVNAKPNYLLLYRLVNDDNQALKLRKKICIKQSEHSIRSTFCPVMISSSKRQQMNCLTCSGSEDFGVYIYDMENDEKPLINKLQGHCAPVLDVGFNYDQSLLASGDNQGTVIVWKTNGNHS
jgi:WD40 repeat protein